MRAHRAAQDRRGQRHARLPRGLGAHRHQGRRMIVERGDKVVGAREEARGVHVRPHPEKQDGDRQMRHEPLGQRLQMPFRRLGGSVERDERRGGSP
jgi:hypothetical protein